jgi:hypothetical protein
MRILDHIKAWITWATATDASDRFRKMEVEAGSLDLLVAPFGRHQSNEQCAPAQRGADIWPQRARQR